MLSLFPNLFTYSLVAPFIIRIVLGAFFLYYGIRHHKEEAAAWNSVWNDKKIGSWTVGSILAKVEIVIGVLLVLGLWTQAAAILVIVFNKVEWYKKHGMGWSPVPEVWTKIFISAMGLALLFLGAGFLATDLPL